jgi:hypothetical protein
MAGKRILPSFARDVEAAEPSWMVFTPIAAWNGTISGSPDRNSLIAGRAGRGSEVGANDLLYKKAGMRCRIRRVAGWCPTFVMGNRVDVDVLGHSASATLGAFVLYILYRHQNRQPFSLFQAINIRVDGDSKAWIILMDMIVSSAIGGISVTLLTRPVTASQAFAAGLGMTGLFSAHLRETGGRPSASSGSAKATSRKGKQP